jgi:hypothetical protein
MNMRALIEAKPKADPQARVLRMLGYALTLQDGKTAEAASAIMQASLSEEQRAMLATIALASLPTEEAERIADLVAGGSGYPTASIGPCLNDATYWAQDASRIERRAYAVAILNAMDAKDRADFLAFAKASA